MSDPNQRRQDETSDGRPPPSPRGLGWAAVLLMVPGVVLLLPGVCSVLFIYVGLVTPVAMIGLAVSAGGVWLIAYALRDASSAQRAAVVVAVVLFLAVVIGVVAFEFRN